MRIYNPSSDNQLHPQLQDLLELYRLHKSFNPSDYLYAKAILLNRYMTKCKLKACVVAVSGGIDSAVVLGIVHFASTLPQSPIEKILPVCLPVSSSAGATGQELATERGIEVCEHYHLSPHVIELYPPHKLIGDTVSDAIAIEGQDWAQGQLVAHTRTPTLYYCATLLTQQDLPAIICGTTNRDEGLYLGYFGKASDGLVDVQLISDLHKSEVYRVAQMLKTPESILKVTPQGDMYDGRVDEEVFGAPYNFVEYYLYFLTLSQAEKSEIHNQLTSEAREQFQFLSNNLENLHSYNRHKYFGASPAVHLDIDYMDVPEGWKTNCSFEFQQYKPKESGNFVGLFMADTLPESFKQPVKSNLDTHIIQGKPVYCVNNALSECEIQWLLDQTKKANWKTANHYGKHEDNLDHAMSTRASIYQETLAQLLFNRIRSHIPALKINHGERILDGKDVWVASGINPLFRYIRYQPGQSLVAHYDDTYQANQYQKTLMTAIIYLNNSSSMTRFISDKQLSIPEEKRDYHDWDRLGTEVELAIPAKAGQIVIFDHRILHDATSPTEEKTIIRTDIMFNSPQFGFKLEQE